MRSDYTNAMMRYIYNMYIYILCIRTLKTRKIYQSGKRMKITTIIKIKHWVISNIVCEKTNKNPS